MENKTYGKIKHVPNHQTAMVYHSFQAPIAYFQSPHPLFPDCASGAALALGTLGTRHRRDERSIDGTGSLRSFTLRKSRENHRKTMGKWENP